jgi:arylsulfatase A-like enzyme
MLKTVLLEKCRKTFGINLAVIILIVLESCQPETSQKSEKPNVVVIFADDMNYKGPSVHGSRWGISTPNIDQLAKEGTRFTNAYVSAPTCGPSRAGLITGRYQTSFGHEFNSPRKEGIGLPLSEKTIGDRMTNLGYKTGIVGKWHLGGDENVGEEYHPLQRGFYYFYGFYGSMVHFFKSDHIFRGTTQVKNPEYLTDIIANESCKFMERNQDEPFFLYSAFNAVHTPLEATLEDMDHIDSLPYFREYVRKKMSYGGSKAAVEKAKYRAAMLLALDRAVGQITNKLEELSLEDNTLVIFTNDNGDYGHFNSPTLFSGGKGNAKEGGIRVPFIMKWPGHIPAGKVYDGITSTLDVLPTAVVAGGGKIKPEWNLHGVNLLPYVQSDKQGNPHDWLFWRMGGTKASRHGKWKLFYNGNSGYGGFGVPEDQARWFLFNLETDPAEQHDLSKVFPGVFEKMKNRYKKWAGKQSEPLWPFGASGQMGQWGEVDGRKHYRN